MDGKWLAAGLGPALALLLAFTPGIAQAVVDADLEAKGWRELPNPNKKENVFRAGADGAIEVVSNDSVSTLYTPVEVDLDEQPMLTWRWRVDEAAPATDLSVKGADDCSLAVYVGFPFEPEQASFFDRLKRPLVESWVGEDAPGRVLRYVFCGRHQQGEVVESPYLGSAGAIEGPPPRRQRHRRVVRGAGRPRGRLSPGVRRGAARSHSGRDPGRHRQHRQHEPRLDRRPRLRGPRRGSARRG